jgi:hypothetical protein
MPPLALDVLLSSIPILALGSLTWAGRRSSRSCVLHDGRHSPGKSERTLLLSGRERRRRFRVQLRYTPSNRVVRWLFAPALVAAALVVRCGQSGDMKSAGCARDEDCPSGFCDRDQCAPAADVGETPPHGRTCVVSRDSTTGERLNRFIVCGAYLCLDGRCRSCRADSECNARGGSGDSVCQMIDGLPGLRCGSPLVGPPPDSTGPPPPDLPGPAPEGP